MPDTDHSARLGRQVIKQFQEETVRAFVPPPLPLVPTVDLAGTGQPGHRQARWLGFAKFGLLRACGSSAEPPEPLRLPSPAANLLSCAIKYHSSQSKRHPYIAAHVLPVHPVLAKWVAIAVDDGRVRSENDLIHI